MFLVTEISVLMETIGRKDLSYFIVLHCLGPQALCPNGVLFYCGFPTTACGFPPGKHVCQFTRTLVQGLWSLPAHLQILASLWELAQL